MESDGSSTVGARVRYWRRRRHLGRQQFADMVGRSTSWLDKVERGDRELLRLPMLERVAEALSIDPAVLTDADSARAAAQYTDNVEVQAIRKALGRYPMLVRRSDDASRPTVDQVREQLDYVGQAWLSSHLAVIGRTLPRLLDDAQAVVSGAASADEEARQRGSRMLSKAYRITCSVLLKYGSTDIAWLAADRALHTAAPGDLIATAGATRSVARAMSHAGQLTESVATAVGMSDRLRPILGRPDPDALPLFGMLLLSAEIAAAKQGDDVAARSLHQEALRAQERLQPDHRGHHTVFGRANVEVHRVSALVRLQDGHHAVRYAEGIEPTLIARLPTERRSNFLLDLTDAYLQTGRYRHALQTLADADRLAPEEVRCRPLAHRLIARLLTTQVGGTGPSAPPAREPVGGHLVTSDRSVLHVVTCGAGPARRVDVLVDLARQQGWDVCIIATPTAASTFLDLRALEALSGHQVRSDYSSPDDESFPPATAIVVAPATYNTINKWAAGISDTYALNILAELTGLGVPTAVLPFVNTALASNRVFTRSIEELRGCGVHVLYGPGGFEPHPPRTGDAAVSRFPWHVALEVLRTGIERE